MNRLRAATAIIPLLLLVASFGFSHLEGQSIQRPASRPNVIVFVADGLRHASVNPQDMPVLWEMQTRGVEFRNSYAVYPTLTMPNASAIAKGHWPGDTGVSGNNLWLGFQAFDSGNFNRAPASPVPFIENDQILSDAAGRATSELLDEESFLEIARAHGYNTAAVGKVGSIAMQDLSAIAAVAGGFPSRPPTLIIDDATGTAAGAPVPQPVILALQREKLSPEAPARNNGYGAASPYNNGFAGDNNRAGTVSANSVQQQWFVDVATRVILPTFAAQTDAPFALVFWSRDPDGTQHNQGDSLGTLYPGINGPTSRLAIQNADRCLGQLLRWLADHPAIEANTDVVVTSDHGFATISRREIDRRGRPTTSVTAQHTYLDAAGRVETERGMLPLGFLAMDLALDLRLGLFDPDQRVLDAATPYKRLRLTGDAWEHPAGGNGLLGDAVLRLDGRDAKVIVAANGGSDLIYVPDGRVDTARAVVRSLLQHDYVGGVFVADKYGPLDGTLPTSAIGLSGAARLPSPDIVVALKVFYLNPDDLRTAIQVADTGLQAGQGNHGGFGRESTYNVMAARGPDFKSGFVDVAPASNADIAPTLLHVLALDKPTQRHGGRMLSEALTGGPNASLPETHVLRSTVENGVQTILVYQELDGRTYAHSACLVAASASKATNADMACRY